MKQKGMVLNMRIDNVNHIASYNSIPTDKETKKPIEGKSAYSKDRIDVANKPSIDQMKNKIKNNILKLEKQQTSSEKLEAIKERISNGTYRVSTDDIIKSIL